MLRCKFSREGWSCDTQGCKYCAKCILHENQVFKAGKAKKKKSREAKKQRSKETGNAQKQNSRKAKKQEKQKSREAGKAGKQRNRKNRKAKKQKSREAEKQEKQKSKKAKKQKRREAGEAEKQKSRKAEKQEKQEKQRSRNPKIIPKPDQKKNPKIISPPNKNTWPLQAAVDVLPSRCGRLGEPRLKFLDLLCAALPLLVRILSVLTCRVHRKTLHSHHYPCMSFYFFLIPHVFVWFAMILGVLCRKSQDVQAIPSTTSIYLAVTVHHDRINK